jgi:CRP/FNR family cyclic AMP-dependent transcriptional regulator
VELVQFLRSVEMFAGLDEEQLRKLATVFEERALQANELLFSQGDETDRLYVVREGFVEIIEERQSKKQGTTIVNLGPGQTVGEMTLIDKGKRSASVRAATDGTRVVSLSRRDFESLCESDTAIGYQVMRNIAADLSFRLRHRGLDDSRS